MKIKQAIDTILNTSIRSLKEEGFDVNKENIFIDKVYQNMLLVKIVKIKTELPKSGFFYDHNKDAIDKYHTAIMILKKMIVNGIRQSYAKLHKE